MRFRRPEGCPCTRDCPDRTLGCRAECEAFRVYDEERMRRYGERYAEKMTRVEARNYEIGKAAKLKRQKTRR